MVLCPYINHVYYHAIDVEEQKCTATNSRNSSSPSLLGQSGDTISQPAIEFGKAMRDLTNILQCADHALKNMLIAFRHMAYYMNNKTYIAIVQSKAYEAVDSVEALFQLLAPHLKSIDCSLLKALVEAAGVELAIQRLDEYLHITHSCLLGNGAKKVCAPCDAESLSQNDSNALVPHDSTSDVVSSPVDASYTAVPVTTVVAGEDMSWGTFRRIQSLLCGIFTVPSCALQYDDKKPGSVVITCTTSLEILSQIQSTLLDDGDMLLLLRKKIVSIQVGKDYTIAVGYDDYWMVSNTPKAVIEVHIENAELHVFAHQNLKSESPITHANC